MELDNKDGIKDGALRWCQGEKERAQEGLGEGKKTGHHDTEMFFTCQKPRSGARRKRHEMTVLRKQWSSMNECYIKALSKLLYFDHLNSSPKCKLLSYL